jgi:hypothetical protein
MSLIGLEQELTQEQLEAAEAAAAARNQGDAEFFVPLDNPYNDAPLPEAVRKLPVASQFLFRRNLRPCNGISIFRQHNFQLKMTIHDSLSSVL